MAKLTKGQQRVLSGNNPRLKINLKELFNLDFSSSESLKNAIGQAIIDKIQERTESNVSLSGKAFRGYSKTYRNSDDFKAAGKSNKVNLRLTGDMLETMNIVETGSNTITIGWDDDDEAAKAHGHITGGGAGGNLPVRDFFGLRSSDISDIRSRFSGDLKDIKKARGDNRDEAILGLIRKLSDDGES